jgi:uncharacterized protein (TIGR02246 family)
MRSIDISQFYARHMQLLDGGAADDWADTFTEDGTFLSPSMSVPASGRAEIAAGARAATAARASSGEVHRHWVTMTVLRELDGDAVEATSAVQILATGAGTGARLHLSCVMRDRLVPTAGGWLVAERHITRDDRPAGTVSP